MPERPMTPSSMKPSPQDTENLKPNKVSSIPLHSNIPHPHSMTSSVERLPLYERDFRTWKDVWMGMERNEYAKKDIWADYDLDEEFLKEDPNDVCGVPRRPLDPEYIKLWKNVNLKNPWSILKLWEAFHEEESADCLVWLDGCGTPERTITWTELARKAFKLGIHLRDEIGVKPGDRIILCFPPGIDFVVAFLTCLFGGFIAVPVYPPTPANQTRDGDRFLDIRKNAGVRIILTNRMYSRVARLMFRLWRGGDASDPEVRTLGAPVWLPVEDSEGISDEAADAYTPATIYPWTCAFLQFTSGSTSQPKGVVVTHGNEAVHI